MSDRGMLGGLYLGCPQWHHRQWTQSIFPAGSTPRDSLAHYSAVFNAVEGNTTFYATPPAQVIGRWASQTPESFRLVLKLPQQVTHERLLDSKALDIARQFLEYMEPLGERLSYTLIQLPAHFDEHRFDPLYRFLSSLPRESLNGSPRHYAVELRAPSLTQPHSNGQGLFEEANALLSATTTERVWMDTRPLRAAPKPYNEPTQLARDRKPNLPVFPMGLGPAPMVRYVAHPDLESNRLWLTDWAEVFAQWIKEDRHPFFFAHYPGETLAPQVASLFYELLRAHLAQLPPRPIWPSEEQLSLF